MSRIPPDPLLFSESIVSIHGRSGMTAKKHVVKLSTEEREWFVSLISFGMHPAQRLSALLKSHVAKSAETAYLLNIPAG
jgi:hypothetical protein